MINGYKHLSRDTTSNSLLNAFFHIFVQISFFCSNSGVFSFLPQQDLQQHHSLNIFFAVLFLLHSDSLPHSLALVPPRFLDFLVLQAVSAAPGRFSYFLQSRFPTQIFLAPSLLTCPSDYPQRRPLHSAHSLCSGSAGRRSLPGRPPMIALKELQRKSNVLIQNYRQGIDQSDSSYL